MKSPNLKQLIPAGRKVGRLTVIECLFTHDASGRMQYRCLCDCGNEKIVSSSYLCQTKSTRSCGCFIKEAFIKKRKYKSAAEYTARCLWAENYKDGCSFEKFMELSQKNCFYCGRPPSNKSNQVTKNGGCTKEWYEQGFFTYNGLDRLDSTKNHDEDNLVTCCKMCNWMKNKYSYNEFISHIKLIYTNLNLAEQI